MTNKTQQHEIYIYEVNQIYFCLQFNSKHYEPPQDFIPCKDLMLGFSFLTYITKLF